MVNVKRETGEISNGFSRFVFGRACVLEILLRSIAGFERRFCFVFHV